jgi:hypothetical protein
MTQEEHAAIAGRVALEHAQIGREIAAVSAEIDHAADVLYKLGTALRQPIFVRFDGESLPEGTRVPEGFGQRSEFAFSSSAVDGKKLKMWVSELREKTIKQHQLAQRMKELGL